MGPDKDKEFKKIKELLAEGQKSAKVSKIKWLLKQENPQLL